MEAVYFLFVFYLRSFVFFFQLVDFYCLGVLNVLLDKHLGAVLCCLLRHLDPKDFVAFELLLKLFLQGFK